MIIHCIILPTESKDKCNAKMQLHQEFSLHMYFASTTNTVYINLLSFNMIFYTAAYKTSITQSPTVLLFTLHILQPTRAY